MEVWRPEEIDQKRPQVLSAQSLCMALALHVAFFLGCYLFAVFHFRKDEVITPIDLTVVVVENLDGNPDEPPPLKKPEPEPPPPPPPKPQPKPKPKEPEKPKELEKIVTNIVEKVEKKPEKKPEVKKPEEPKKTAKELREEKIKRMREKAKDTKAKPTAPQPPQPNGRTAKKTLTDAEIQKLLNAGYRPGSTTNLAASEEQLCFSLIKQAFEAKWDKPPWTDTLKPMVMRVWFGGGGRIVKYNLEGSSGDPQADATIKSAAARVGVVQNLTASFIEKYGRSGVPIRFTVKPQ